MERIRQTEELARRLGTNEWQLLSSNDGALSLSAQARARTALVGNGSNHECVLLVAPGFRPSQAYFEAMSRAVRSDYVVTPYYAEQSVLTLLNSSAQASREDSKEVVTQEDRDRLNELVTEAVSRGAADIMISPHKGNLSQYMAELDIDTVITPYRDYTREEVEGMMRYFYAKQADQDTVEEPVFKFSTAQFAAGDGVWGGHRTRIRYQSKVAFPAGTDFALRLLAMSETSGFNRIEDLKITSAQARMLALASKRDSGAIVLAGQTSSGKTTTVKVLLESLHRARPDIVIRSLESPPEYIIRGVHQHAVRESKGGELQSLSEHVKELMRMNPTYLFMGEVRGSESANLFLHMLDSGHGVITTSHAGSPVGIYNKLESQGVSRAVTTQHGYINALIFQRRLPRLCSNCKIPIHQSDRDNDKAALERLRILQVPLDNVHVANPEGCPECARRGIRGTRVAMDVVRPDNRMADMIREGNIGGFNKRWAMLCHANGWGDAAETSLYHSLRLVLEGEISIHTVETRYSEIEPTLLADECRTWTEGGFGCAFQFSGQ